MKDMNKTTVNDRLGILSYADLTEPQDVKTKTSLERAYFYSDSVNHTSDQQSFFDNGVLKFELPLDVIDAYAEFRENALPKDQSQASNYWAGFHFPTPFMLHEPLRDLALCRPLVNKINHLVGEVMGLNLALTGWVSTQRNFHADFYLNPSALGSRYLAVWIALEDIDPDSGPFEYVAGSHLWPTLTREKLFSHLTPEERTSPHWPTFTQDQVARMCEEEIQRRNAKVTKFIPKKGECLIWHSNLVHRGSVPKNPDLLRKSLILHYSGVNTRSKIDMPKFKFHKDIDQVYFDLAVDGEVKPK